METIKSIKEYIPKMVNGCKQTVEDLQEGNEANALQLVPHIIEGLDWIVQALAGIQKNGLLLNIDFNELNSHLGEMLSSLEINDYVLLADIIDYELVPILNDWLSKVNSVEI
ncbi:hypothetical protein [Bacillus sp. AK031]